MRRRRGRGVHVSKVNLALCSRSVFVAPFRVCSAPMRFQAFIRPARALFPVAAAAAVASLTACGGSTPPAQSGGSLASSGTPAAVHATKPESDKVTWKKEATPKNCHQTAKGADLAAQTTAIATGCVDAAKMHQVGTPTTGEGQDGTSTMVKSIPLAAKANHCYRIFGLAEATVTDFDIAVMDSAGKLAGEDTTDANDAIVLEDGAICFTADDTASVNTAVASGKGKWAVEIWGD
jgi:hypothetical protein